MKLKEFKEMINELPKDYDDCQVIIQEDPEGNGYREVGGVDDCGVLLESAPYSLEVASGNWTAKEVCMDYSEDEIQEWDFSRYK